MNPPFLLCESESKNPLAGITWVKTRGIPQFLQVGDEFQSPCGDYIGEDSTPNSAINRVA